MIKRSFWIALGACTLLMASCTTKRKGTFAVSGTFKNADKLSAVEGPISKAYLVGISYGKDQPPGIGLAQLVHHAARLPQDGVYVRNNMRNRRALGGVIAQLARSRVQGWWHG